MIAVDSLHGKERMMNYEIDKPHGVVVVMGKSGSGKSLYLKTLGCIVYLAQIGSYVPALSANLPIFDSILTKFELKADPNLKQNLFKKEQELCNEILKNSSPNSLILIDQTANATSEINSQVLF